MILDSTTKQIRAWLDSAAATAQPQWTSSWADHDAGGGNFTPGGDLGVLNDTTPVVLVDSPGASIQRQAKQITIFNSDTAQITLIIDQYDGADSRQWSRAVLEVDESYQWEPGGTWHAYDANGVLKANSTVIGAVPIGSIVMWSGTIASVPAGWAFCNGIDNSPGPDLRDQFIVGAKQDDAGVAKTNIEGALSVSGGTTGHSHSAHANLTHAGGAVADHTGLTHGLTIANHPDLTHPALSHAASTFTHADHTIPSASHSHAAITLTHADHSLASFSGTDASRADLSVPSHSHASLATASRPSLTFNSRTGITVGNTVTRSRVTTGGLALTDYSGIQASNQTAPSGTIASGADVSVPTMSGASAANASMPSLSHAHAASTVTHADHSVASFSGTNASLTLGHADHSFPSLSHQDIGTHAGTAYGVHTFTAPAAHGAAGTLTHAYTEPSDHSISAHDTVSNVIPYYALAFIQRMT